MPFLSDAAFPLQEPIRNHAEAQAAIDLIKLIYAENVKDGGGEFVMHIDHLVEDRTEKQHGGCMLWFTDIAEQTGCTVQAARMFCMKEFFNREEHVVTLVDKDGEETIRVVENVRSFGTLSKDETRKLMDEMPGFFGDFGITLRELKTQ